MSRAALLTAAQASGIGVVAFTGNDATKIFQNIFTPHQQQKANTPNPSQIKLLYGLIHDHHETIDHVIAAINPLPQTIEIYCHGGPRILQRILMLLKQNGAELTTWQKILPADSIKNELAITLPLAKTRLAVRALAHQYPTGLHQTLTQLIGSLKPPNQTQLDSARQTIKQLLATHPLALRLLYPATVVLAGPVNAGKSTLANALAGKAQSIAADLPGTTRDWTQQLIDIAGLPVRLIDTAGLRPTDDHIEQHALVHAHHQIGLADLVVIVVPAGPNQTELLNQQTTALNLRHNPLRVANKADLAAATQPNDTPNPPISISALHQTNLDQLRQAILRHFGLHQFDPAAPLVFTPRQVEILHNALNAPNIPTLTQTLQSLITPQTPV